MMKKYSLIRERGKIAIARQSNCSLAKKRGKTFHFLRATILAGKAMAEKAYEMKPIFTDLLSYYGGPQGAHRMSILAKMEMTFKMTA